MSVFLKRLGICIALMLLQIFALDRICILGYVTPYIYIYLVLILDSDVGPARRMLWGFAMGLVADVFTDTPGVQAAALTLTAYLQPYMLRLFITFDRRTRLNPGIVSMGAGPCSLYFIAGSFVFNLARGLLSISPATGLLMFCVEVVICSLLSYILMFVTEWLLRRRRRKYYR